MSAPPKYTANKKKGNIGESFVKYILSSFCLPHKIDGSYDLGNDFICELLKGEHPTNILFYVQVKYWKNEPRDSELKKTIEYWRGSQIPVYLFWVRDEKFPKSERDIKIDTKIPGLKYKRYTSISHNPSKHKNEKFKIFNKETFLRDLMVDYARCQYNRGMTTVLRQEDFIETKKGKIKLGDNCLFVSDVIPDDYSKPIINNSWTNILASAVVLSKSKNEPSLMAAKQAIDLAEVLFGHSLNACKYYPGFIGIIKKYKTDIESKIKKYCKNKNN